MNPITFSEELKGLGVHEAYHVLQYRYVYEHGGSKAIKKLLEDVRKVNYEDNILEEGAYVCNILVSNRILKKFLHRT